MTLDLPVLSGDVTRTTTTRPDPTVTIRDHLGTTNIHYPGFNEVEIASDSQGHNHPENPSLLDLLLPETSPLQSPPLSDIPTCQTYTRVESVDTRYTKTRIVVRGSRVPGLFTPTTITVSPVVNSQEGGGRDDRDTCDGTWYTRKSSVPPPVHSGGGAMSGARRSPRRFSVLGFPLCTVPSTSTSTSSR